jgi:aryl-alcohol dehydrogenase-like predicted oxidoreductase
MFKGESRGSGALMDKKRLGTLEVSALGLGCMGMTGFYGHADQEQCVQTIQTAFEQGVSFFDTADNYGFGENEVLLGEAIAPFRNKVSIATKVGVVRSKENPSAVSINGKPEYIKNQCAASLKRLRVSTIDLYYLHHLDPHTPIEETMHAMAELVAEGKIRHIGLGEIGTENIRRAHKIYPITAIQAEYSLFFRETEKRLIPLCQELGIGLVACAPLCRSLLTGSIASFDGLQAHDFRRFFPRFSQTNLPHNLKIVEDLRKIAKKKACSLSQLALGWLSSQSSSIVPIFGTNQSSHLIENISPMKFSASDIREINEMMAQVSIQGDRLTDAARPFYRID